MLDVFGTEYANRLSDFPLSSQLVGSSMVDMPTMIALTGIFLIGHAQIVSAVDVPALLYLLIMWTQLIESEVMIGFLGGECLIQPYWIYHQIACESLKVMYSGQGL
jgi:hypothetical protein